MQIGVDSAKAVENKRLFVVDDDDITRSVLQFMLHDENETHDLESLEAAYSKAEQWKPDAVLLGVSILESKGVEVIQQIKAKLDAVKIILIAKTPDEPLLASGLEAGADGTLAKPLKLENVRAKVDEVLGRK